MVCIVLVLFCWLLLCYKGTGAHKLVAGNVWSVLFGCCVIIYYSSFTKIQGYINRLLEMCGFHYLSVLLSAITLLFFGILP